MGDAGLLPDQQKGDLNMAGGAEISRHEKYVLVNVEGDSLSPQEIYFTLSKAVEQAVESRLSIVIYREAPVKQQASMVDFYHYGRFLSESAFSSKLALAFPEEMHHDNLDFFVTTSRNRGIRLRLFSTMEEAVNWIGGDDERIA